MPPRGVVTLIDDNGREVESSAIFVLEEILNQPNLPREAKEMVRNVMAPMLDFVESSTTPKDHANRLINIIISTASVINLGIVMITPKEARKETAELYGRLFLEVIKDRMDMYEEIEKKHFKNKENTTKSD